ncbi:MAG: transporter substrate-binding domain-containing protein [Gammaproteobacteria bacterium]|nr:MAG: transporter substrate-binding domain-containing protein [Gammaproteobacteria bacterium]
MRTKIVAGLMLMFTWSLHASAEVKVLKANDSNDPNGAYTTAMIQLALDHLEPNKYKLKVGNENYTQARSNEEVAAGRLDLVWTTSDKETEEYLEPVRIPLFKGLLGCRIFIIRKGDQAKFDNISTMEDLKKLTYGQGKTWADAKILEANGLKVTKTNKYENLFFMLDGERFDAFPRGVHEPFGELEKRPNLNLTVEKNILLVYKMDFYVYTSKENKKLARELEEGFNRAIADGSFDKLFYSSPSVKDIIANANMKNRKVFYLDNPTLSKETPLDRKELWVNPKDF